MPASWKGRLLAGWIALVALLAANPALAQEPGSFEAAAMVDAVGAPKNPAYIHINELANVEAVEFKRAPERQVSRLGGRPIRLDPKKKTYLWAIDRAGNLYVAPVEKRKDGTESIGHTMLLDGRPARLAGEFVFKEAKKGKRPRWEINNDSGRYSNRYAEVRKRDLKAARRLIEAIGVEGAGEKKKHRGRLRLELSFRAPDRYEENQSRKKRLKARKALLLRDFGGYLLKPGKKSKPLPEKYRSLAARRAWAKRAREKIAGPSRSGWHGRIQAGESDAPPSRARARRGARPRPVSRTRSKPRRARVRR